MSILELPYDYRHKIKFAIKDRNIQLKMAKLSIDDAVQHIVNHWVLHNGYGKKDQRLNLNNGRTYKIRKYMGTFHEAFTSVTIRVYAHYRGGKQMIGEVNITL